jgi:hypothetical protein
MRKIFIGLLFLTTFSCTSNQIDLTGNFDFVIDNRVVGTLTLNQSKENKLSGFLRENGYEDSRRNKVYQVQGLKYYDDTHKAHKIDITVLAEDKRIYSGYASDSNSIIGIYIGTRDLSRHEWMAIREQE